MLVLQGTLDLLVLRTLAAGGQQHGYAILARLRDASGDELEIEDAALYPALHRLEARGLVESEWGLSENNRRAKFYRLTASGSRRLEAEKRDWKRRSLAINRLLEA